MNEPRILPLRTLSRGAHIQSSDYGAGAPAQPHAHPYARPYPQPPHTLGWRTLRIRSPLSARWWAVMRGVAVAGSRAFDLWVERRGDTMMERLARHPARGL